MNNPANRLKFAIYDCPEIVGRKISDALKNAGHSVLYDGPLNKGTAVPEADIWIAKWTFLFNNDFLSHHHPGKGIISLSVGTDHIDMNCVAKLGLVAQNCPKFSSNSVAEHAMALAMRSSYRTSALPPLSAGKLIFTRFSDDFAEPAVAQMLARSRQFDESMMRACNYEYYRKDMPDRRHDSPWLNEELSGMKIGIVGSERSGSRLAKTLSMGFKCELYGYETSDELDAYVEHMNLLDMLEKCDYVFLCTEKFGLQAFSEFDQPKSVFAQARVDSRNLPYGELELYGSSVSVLGTGRIGSRIARMARFGFNCRVNAFNRSHDEDLKEMGVRYVDTVEQALADSNFIFIALPLNEGTRSLIGEKELSAIPSDKQRVIINVTRDKIIESEPLYTYLASGAVSSYATDVLPNDYVLWKGGEPDDTTKRFVQHRSVVPTPHEGDCSSKALDRMVQEVFEVVENIMK
jgi:lactate dehydrogenase-like 2-hydroxyacid dehydrogenase